MIVPMFACREANVCVHCVVYIHVEGWVQVCGE